MTIGVRRGVSKMVEDVCRLPALMAGHFRNSCKAILVMAIAGPSKSLGSPWPPLAKRLWWWPNYFPFVFQSPFNDKVNEWVESSTTRNASDLNYVLRFMFKPSNVITWLPIKVTDVVKTIEELTTKSYEKSWKIMIIFYFYLISNLGQNEPDISRNI